MSSSIDLRAQTLANRLRDRIKRDGPITFHDWMQAALYDDLDGYYRRPGLIRQGRAGDYRTAAEASPLFGVTFAHYFAKCYFMLGAPKSWTIVEVGAGRGDFAHAVLQTLRRDYPQVFAATRYVIDEINDHERGNPEHRLSGPAQNLEFRSLRGEGLGFEYGVVFSNELLDAFPVHRVIGRDQALRELCVDINAGEFVWRDCELSPPVSDYCRKIGLRLDDQQIFEINLAAEEFIGRAARIFQRGFLISVDYGAERTALLNDPSRSRGTLRAFYRHRLVEEALLRPGEIDLTTTVDWTQVEEAGVRNGLENLRCERLDQFLIAEGLLSHLSNAMAELNDTAEIMRLTTGARELVMPNGLAAHFQVLVQGKKL